MNSTKENYIDNYCQEKGYQISKKSIQSGVQLTVFDSNEKITIAFYSIGKMVTGGNANLLLHKEFKELEISLKQKPDLT